MPMIGVYATVGTFDSKHELARDLAQAVMPDIAAAERAALSAGSSAT